LSPFFGVSPAHLYDKAREGHQEGQAQDGPNLSKIALQISKCSAIFSPAKGLKTALAQRLTIEIPAYVFEIPGKVVLIVTDSLGKTLSWYGLL